MTSRLAVVIAAYNAAQHIAETLRSIQSQTLVPDEIILVDDGSTDATVEVAKSVSPKIIIIQQANAGPSSARNTGILASRSRYIAPVDADDLLQEDHFELVVSALEENPEVALAFGDILEFGPQGSHPRSFWQKTADDHQGVQMTTLSSGVQLLGTGLTPALFRGNIIPVSTTVFRRSSLAHSGLFAAANRAGEDMSINLRLSQFGPFAFVGKITGHKRVHENSLTSQAKGHAWAEVGLRVLTAFQAMYPDSVQSSEARHALRQAIREKSQRLFYHSSIIGAASLMDAAKIVRSLGWDDRPTLRDWGRALVRRR